MSSENYTDIVKHNFHIKSITNELNGYVAKRYQPSVNITLTKGFAIVKNSSIETPTFTSILAYLFKF